MSWVRCPVHGHTDDTIRVTRSGRKAAHPLRYDCRRCIATPCEVHGTDYSTVKFDRHGNKESFCISCDPRMLEDIANYARNGYK